LRILHVVGGPEVPAGERVERPGHDGR
jgi:hypothetical protein